MVELVEGRVYRTWALVTRGGRGMHRLIDVQAEGNVPYAVLEWRAVRGYEEAVLRVALDVTRLRQLDWPQVDLLYTARVDVPPDAPADVALEAPPGPLPDATSSAPAARPRFPGPGL